MLLYFNIYLLYFQVYFNLAKANLLRTTIHKKRTPRHSPDLVGRRHVRIIPLKKINMEALDSLQPYLEFELWGTSIKNFTIALAVLLGLIVIFKIFRSVILIRLKKMAKKTKTDFDDIVVEMIEEIPQNFYWIISAFVAFQFIQLENPTVNKVVTGIFLVFIVLRGIIFLQKLLGYILQKTLSNNGENETAVHGIRIIMSIALWAIGILLVLQNLGFEISTLVASLGIGGIAIAFAFQQILADLFSSFAIYFDKPFKIGDYVSIGTDSGNIKKIGMKTTRITTLQGEELVVSNTELTSTRIKNFKRMKKRRAEFRFGVVYETPSAKLQKIPQMVETIINEQKLAEFDRCHFHEFGDFSLNFVVIYHVLNREYADYMDTQQSINFAIKTAFEKAKIDMAFPTQTVYVQK
jgi:small-conductance mechanosensitive channel